MNLTAADHTIPSAETKQRPVNGISAMAARSARGMHPSHTYANAGQYVIKARVHAAEDWSGRETTTVNVVQKTAEIDVFADSFEAS